VFSNTKKSIYIKIAREKEKEKEQDERMKHERSK
jgi:hypothetical protein